MLKVMRAVSLCLLRTSRRSVTTSLPGLTTLRKNSHPVIGYGYVHTALDDHSRLAYSEVFPDETATTTAAWWQRAISWFADHRIRIERVLTDNGPCYRSALWLQVCRQHRITPKRTRPYRPQTNEGRAVPPHPARRVGLHPGLQTALRKWLHLYNHHRTHTSLGGKPPASRVTNLPGQYS